MTTACQAEDAEANFPEVCIQQGIQFDSQNLILSKGSGQSLFVFHNKSGSSFWLNHPVGKDPAASAGWASEVGPDNWSALTLGGESESFAITCSLIGGDGVKDLDCREVLESCKITDASFKLDNLGSFWVAENMPKQQLIEAIRSRGISW